MDENNILNSCRLKLEKCMKIGVVKDLYNHEAITREQFEQLMEKFSKEQFSDNTKLTQ